MHHIDNLEQNPYPPDAKNLRMIQDESVTTRRDEGQEMV
jgi:hypothetical protein